MSRRRGLIQRQLEIGVPGVCSEIEDRRLGQVEAERSCECRGDANQRGMRHLPTVQFEGLRKVYVRRGDVLRLLGERTFTKEHVPASRAHP